MPVDFMSITLPVCCGMGTCAYEVFQWQRVFKSKHKNTLPNGVHDDKRWTPPKATKSDRHNKYAYKEEDKIVKEGKIVHENLDQRPSMMCNQGGEGCQISGSLPEDGSTSKIKDSVEQFHGLTLNQGN